MILVGSLSLTFVIVLVGGLAVSQATSTPAASLSSSVTIVYLPDRAQPVMPPSSMRALGVIVATSAPDLVTAAATADAIVIDRSQLSAVQTSWLAAQY